VSALTDQLDTDLGNITSRDIPKTIVIAGNSVTGLVEEIKRTEKNDFGGYDLELSTRLHVRTALLTNAPTIGIVITVNGDSKRIVSYTKSIDDNLWMIDVDDPG